jgi:hypothetical protein
MCVHYRDQAKSGSIQSRTGDLLCTSKCETDVITTTPLNRDSFPLKSVYVVYLFPHDHTRRSFIFHTHPVHARPSTRRDVSMRSLFMLLYD